MNLVSEKCKNGTFRMHTCILGSFMARGCKMNVSIQSDFEIGFAQCHSSGFIRVWFPSSLPGD